MRQVDIKKKKGHFNNKMKIKNATEHLNSSKF